MCDESQLPSPTQPLSFPLVWLSSHLMCLFGKCAMGLSYSKQVWKHVEVTVVEPNRVQVYDIQSEATEELDFKDRVRFAVVSLRHTADCCGGVHVCEGGWLRCMFRARRYRHYHYLPTRFLHAAPFSKGRAILRVLIP